MTIPEIENEMFLTVKKAIDDNRFVLDALDPEIRNRIARQLGYGPFGVDGWLISVNSYLGGVRPLDLLPPALERVMAAAVAGTQPISHG